jgi:hypothetical protein
MIAGVVRHSVRAIANRDYLGNSGGAQLEAHCPVRPGALPAYGGAVTLRAMSIQDAYSCGASLDSYYMAIAISV